MRTTRGPEFIRFFEPIVAVLKESGGSGTANEVTDAVIERLKIPENEQLATNKNGGSRVRNQIAWARFYLAKLGWLDSSSRGVWTLTKAGSSEQITHARAIELFKQVHAQMPRRDRNDDPNQEPEAEASDITVEHEDRDELAFVLRGLPPAGFERLCQRLLREAGFESVVVTGKTGDGGVDGHGIFKLNPFVTFKVMFQCKRYQGAVSAPQIRDFRGAMLGRADKGIVITTGTFTTEATKEARRDGVPPIELVDGKKLMEMFESLGLGLVPMKSYRVDHAFFDQFRKSDAQTSR